LESFALQINDTNFGAKLAEAFMAKRIQNHRLIHSMDTVFSYKCKKNSDAIG